MFSFQVRKNNTSAGYKQIIGQFYAEIKFKNPNKTKISIY